MMTELGVRIVIAVLGIIMGFGIGIMLACLLGWAKKAGIYYEEDYDYYDE